MIFPIVFSLLTTITAAAVLDPPTPLPSALPTGPPVVTKYPASEANATVTDSFFDALAGAHGIEAGYQSLEFQLELTGKCDASNQLTASAFYRNGDITAGITLPPGQQGQLDFGLAPDQKPPLFVGLYFYANGAISFAYNGYTPCRWNDNDDPKMECGYCDPAGWDNGNVAMDCAVLYSSDQPYGPNRFRTKALECQSRLGRF